MKIVECPRDAIQGIVEFIPTQKKIDYINQLLKVGFDTIDFGSFVSHKAIPQLKDTPEVLSKLDLNQNSSKLLTIIANIKGARHACDFHEIDYLGFPLSISEEFQKCNTNKDIHQALRLVEEIQNLAINNNKELIVYLSMAFGNPYQEFYHPDLVAKLTSKLDDIEIRTISLADTIGVSNPENITQIFSTLIPLYPHIEFGAHFHSTIDTCHQKINTAFENGCRRFDSTIKGYGGCPMANNKLVGNIPTEELLLRFEDAKSCLNMTEFYLAVNKFEQLLM